MGAVVMAKRIQKWAKKPPGRAEVTNEYDEMVLELKARPDEWGLVSRSPGKQALGREAMRNRGCEVVSQHKDGHTEVWAKWRALPADEGEGEGESSVTTSTDDG
jgi:hypothetical protein